jgi:hypothetical protein
MLDDSNKILVNAYYSAVLKVSYRLQEVYIYGVEFPLESIPCSVRGT